MKLVFDNTYRRIMKGLLSEAVHVDNINPFDSPYSDYAYKCEYNLMYIVIEDEFGHVFLLKPHVHLKRMSNDIGNEKYKIVDFEFRCDSERPIRKFENLNECKNSVGFFKRFQCKVSLSMLSEAFKSFLKSIKLDEYLSEISGKNGGDEKHKAKDIASSLHKLLMNELQSNNEFNTALMESEAFVSICNMYTAEMKKQNIRDKFEDANWNRYNKQDFDISFVSDADEGDNFAEIKFNDGYEWWFTGKDGVRYKLTGARIEAHIEDYSFDYDYGSAHGVNYQFAPEVDDIVWYYENPRTGKTR